MITKYWKMVLLLLLILNFCAKNPSAPEYQKEVVIFGFLWGNEYLSEQHAIMVNYTAPVQQSYSINDAAIENAVVKLKDLSTGHEVLLKEIADRPGFYYHDELLIKPNAAYLLTVHIEDKLVTATTTVPPLLTLETKLDSEAVNFVYRDNLGFEKPIKLFCENEEQIIYVDMFCNEDWQNAEYLDSFGANSKPKNRAEYDQGKNAEPRHIQAFMRLKDLKTSFYPDEYVIFWYHSMIVFYGSNTMQLLAIDANYHNYLYQEHPELKGGINGGIGVFGSVCGEDFILMVMKK